MTVNGQTIIGSILQTDIGAGQFFLEEGMHCFDCPASKGETIEEACTIHGVDQHVLIKKLNAYFASR